MQLSYKQIVIFTILLSFLPFLGSCDITYGFPAVSIEPNGHFLPVGLLINATFVALALFFVWKISIGRINKKLKYLPISYGLYGLLIYNLIYISVYFFFLLVGDSIAESMITILATIAYPFWQLLDNVSFLEFQLHSVWDYGDFKFRFIYFLTCLTYFGIGSIVGIIRTKIIHKENAKLLQKPK